MDGLDLLYNVWSTQEGRYVCISTKKAGEWQDHFFEDLSEAQAFVHKNRRVEGLDLYWCPMKFHQPRRLKQHVAAVRYLWQDLDYCSPSKIPDTLMPSVVWESSPGRFHALWELSESIEPQRAATVNRALAHHLAPKGADKGGWDLTQVLRIPGTRNWKYPNGPKVVLRTQMDRPWPLQRIANQVVKQEVEEEKTTALPRMDAGPVLAKWKDQLSNKVKELLLTAKVMEGKRSDVLWYLGHELMKAGLSPAEVKALIQGSVWNKYRGRSDEDERLDHEVSRAFEDEVLGGSDSGGSSRKAAGGDEEAEDDDSADGLSLRIESDEELMSDLSSYPGWLVEGFWTRRSHGMVAGEPKSFKSTILTDLALSVASGAPFLGKFAVNDPGPVLIVQNENANWIMKDRNTKIRAGKGLIGSVVKLSGNEIDVEWAPELPIYYINQQGFSMSDPIHRKLVTMAVEQIKPVLVIFDPLYLMFDGDLNMAKDLAPVLQFLLSLKIKHNLSLIVVHHFRKTQGSSRGGQNMMGSATLHGWIESAWYLRVGNAGAESEDEPDDNVNKSAASAQVTIEREFRGAGMFPKVDLTLKMGAFGEDSYSVEVEKHDASRKGQGQANVAQLAVEILQCLDLSTKPMSIRSLTTEVGMSRRLVTQEVQRLEQEGKIRVVGKGYVVNR